MSLIPTRHALLLTLAFTTGMLLSVAVPPAHALLADVTPTATSDDSRHSAPDTSPGASDEPAEPALPLVDALLVDPQEPPAQPPAPAPAAAAVQPTCDMGEVGQRALCLAGRHGVADLRLVLSSRYGHWGAADIAKRTIYLSPAVPPDRVGDVLLHEIAHLRLHDALGLGIDAGRRQLNELFGGSGWRGADLAADCLARAWGAAWTHYTACTDPAQRGALGTLPGL